ncbi:MAG: phosphoribosylformylglycinamidine synthase subunit PurQ, partial [Oscillospiraceae bacterium]|nr:phosphoribosylformylglycinamidine synthase subunit PurQ [Oscillospiraceae bacterium]
GRFIASPDVLARLASQGQIATQYTDENGIPGMDVSVNPNGSVSAIEGIISKDGRVLGKMGHTERWGSFVARNIAGEKHQPIFEGGVSYFL